MLEQFLLEYEGFSASRGRCHIVLDRLTASALVGDPRDNPGTSVPSAIEQVGLELSRTLSFDVYRGRLYEYVPWGHRLRHEQTSQIEYLGDAWSMPVRHDVDPADPFVVAALREVHRIQPYALSEMTHLDVVNPLVRLRIEAPLDPTIHELVAGIGTVEHISQRRFFYVDVAARTQDAALKLAREALAPHVEPDRVQATTPNAPLDQRGTLPV